MEVSYMRESNGNSKHKRKKCQIMSILWNVVCINRLSKEVERIMRKIKNNYELHISQLSNDEVRKIETELLRLICDRKVDEYRWEGIKYSILKSVKEYELE